VIDRTTSRAKGVKPGARADPAWIQAAITTRAPRFAPSCELIRTRSTQQQLAAEQSANTTCICICSWRAARVGQFSGDVLSHTGPVDAQGWQPRVIGNFVLSTLLTRKVRRTCTPTSTPIPMRL